mmetsp:Transcript_13689/g.51188  ORF Transcript_13689/g.51188 Transcript_13689/m.51188 type:complete len:314 (+) Transcript_13689:2818-3759(+)
MIITCAVFLGPRKRFTDDTTSALLSPQTGSVFTRPQSHLLHSSSQLLTKLVGHTISARFTVGLPSVPCFSSVHKSAMPCKVLPNPMSSARMHPFPSNSLKPSTHSNMNFTPSLWCGLSHFTSMWSTSMLGRQSAGFFSGASSHSTRGSIPGGRGSSFFSSLGLATENGAVNLPEREVATFAVLPHGTNLRRFAKRRASSADVPLDAPANGALNGRASTAATFWHFNPLTMVVRATCKDPESICCTFRALTCAWDIITGSSSSSSRFALTSKSSSESFASELSELSELSKSEPEASDIVTKSGANNLKLRCNPG